MARDNFPLLIGYVLKSLILSVLMLGPLEAQERQPLSTADVEMLLDRGASPAAVAVVVEEQGVSFTLTPAVEARLREAGADGDLLLSIERARPVQQQAEPPPVEVGERVVPAPNPIADLLRQAEQQYRANRLTTPAGNNALETYEAILQQEPGNSEAKAGIERIKEKYAQWAEAAERREEWEEALSFYDRALQATPEDEQVVNAREEVREKQAALQAEAEQRAAEKRAAAEEKRRMEEERRLQREGARRQAEAEAARSEREAAAMRRAAQRREAEEEAQRGQEDVQRQDEEERVQTSGEMVEVPAGEFWMGCNKQVDDLCDNDEKPGRQVYLDGFRIDTTEVTVGHYQQCVEAGSCSEPKTEGLCSWGSTSRERYPINCVDWSKRGHIVHGLGNAYRRRRNRRRRREGLTGVSTRGETIGTGAESRLTRTAITAQSP